MCVCVCVCVCLASVFSFLLYLTRRGRTWILSSDCKTDQADFTDWMSFLTCDPMEEIPPNPEALSTNT